MKYAMRGAEGVLFTIFDAHDLADAVAIKLEIQRLHNEDWGVDEIFYVAKATPRDFRDFARS
jgi:hypothetical protein